MLDAAEQDDMERHVADDPERHPLIPGGSGMRKARWAHRGSGKRGGFICVYAKNEKENLSDAEKQALAKILQPIKQQAHQARSRTD
jgi:hypothetical protein